jgi:hypothetical protein
MLGEQAVIKGDKESHPRQSSWIRVPPVRANRKETPMKISIDTLKILADTNDGNAKAMYDAWLECHWNALIWANREGLLLSEEQQKTYTRTDITIASRQPGCYTLYVEAGGHHSPETLALIKVRDEAKGATNVQ